MSNLNTRLKKLEKDINPMSNRVLNVIYKATHEELETIPLEILIQKYKENLLSTTYNLRMHATLKLIGYCNRETYELYFQYFEPVLLEDMLISMADKGKK